MDATLRPLTIPPEFANYAEKHGIFDLYKRMLSELIINKPSDPLEFLIQYLQRDDNDVPQIVVLGPPAAGKCSIAKMLCKSLGAVHVTTEDCTQEADLILKAELKQHEDDDTPISDDLWAKVVGARLKMFDAVKKGWVLDGIPNTRCRATALSSLGLFPKHCVVLSAPDAVVIERASGKRVDPVTGDIYHTTFEWPTNPTVANRLKTVPDSSQNAVVEKLVEYHRNIGEILSCYGKASKTINADQPKSDVYSQVLTFVCELPRSIAPRTPRIILLGPPGSGKAVQASLLANKYRIINVCCGELIKQAVAADTSTGQACKSYVEMGVFVPDALVLQLLKERLSQVDCIGRGWVLYGYPNTYQQAEQLEAAGFIANRIFFLNVPNEAIMERLTLRGTDPKTGEQHHMLYNPPRTQEIADRLQINPRDSQDRVHKKLAHHHTFKDEIIEYFNKTLMHVNADQDAHTVFETIESLIVNPLPKERPAVA